MPVSLEEHSSPVMAAGARKRVVLFEPHEAGHAHMRYSSGLAGALAQNDSERRYSLLVSTGGAGPETGCGELEIAPAVRTPRPIGAYGSRALGVLDRCAGWGRADRQIVNWVRAHPDTALVHYQDFYGLATLCGVSALRRLGIRTLLSVHNIRPHMFPWWQPALLKDSVDRHLFRHFDALAVHSAGLKRKLAEFLGTKTPPIFVVPHGVGRMLRPGPLAPLRERMAVRRLLFVGAPRPNKGLTTLLDAIRLIPDCSLTISGLHGSDPRFSELIGTKIDNAQCQGGRIAVRSGFVPDVELDAILRNHSVVMLPYRRDFQAQSGVLAQAIAYRLPVVATDVGAVGETVREFGLGCVVPPEDPAALAEGVRQLYALNPEHLQARLEAAADALAWSSLASTWAEVYDAVCD